MKDTTTEHIHIESWSGSKIPDSDGWVHSKCDTCGYAWKNKTVTEPSGVTEESPKTKPLDTTTTIDELIAELRSGTINFDDQAKQAIRSYVLEVIGEDEDKFADVPDYAMMKPVYHIRNTLKAEQRAKLDQTLKAIGE